jgi:ectoine hydroxylase-related dioxygenase (phytanoyl-CoA dioxygenase family)
MKLSSGYELVENVFTLSECQAILTHLPKTGYCLRDPLIQFPEIIELIRASKITELFPHYSIVRSVFFQKPNSNNWHVPLHQDKLVQVSHKIELPGFGPWSVKNNINHVQPTPEIMNQVISLRIHLSDCSANDGPLEIIPNSHLTNYEPLYENSQSTEITGEAGSLLIFSPLCWHKSKKCKSNSQRAVLHMEISKGSLPEKLSWNTQIALTRR